MRITRLEILKVPPSWVWLRVHTDAGVTGLGEPFLENHGDSVIAEVRRLEPAPARAGPAAPPGALGDHVRGR